MEIKIDKESIIIHNKHILNVSGGNFAIINPSNLEFAIDSVNNESDPLKQATNFLYYTATGHPFENGNKRTAFEVAKGILASGALILDAQSGAIIQFITGNLAQGNATKKDVENWLISNSKPLNKNSDFNEVTTENINKDKRLLKKLD